MKFDYEPAFFWSLGWPDLMRTSRSTLLKDKSPNARPEAIPASDTRIKLITMNTQKSTWQHGT